MPINVTVWQRIALSLFLFCAGSLWAQPAVQSQALFDDVVGSSSVYAVTLDSSGNTFAVGYAGLDSAFVAKVSTDLQVIFAVTLPVEIIQLAHVLVSDSAGNLYITGTTSATWCNPPYPPSFYPCQVDAFLMKLDGATGKILSTTYLGGKGDDVGTAIAIAPDGSIYIGGTTNSPDFPLTGGALIPALPNTPAGFVAHFAADAKTVLGSTYWNGAVAALALDTSGAVYVTGQTLQPSPGTPGAFQTTTRLLTLMASNDNGATWADLTAPRPLRWLEPDLNSPGVLYGATMAGVVKSTDSGATWSTLGGALAGLVVDQVRVHPTDKNTLYAIAESATSDLWKSSDAGSTWTKLLATANALQIDRTHPDMLYAILGGGGILISHDAGNSWSSSRFPPTQGLAVDAQNGDILYSGDTRFLSLDASADSGAHFNQLYDMSPNIVLAVPNPLYASGSTVLYSSLSFQLNVGGLFYNGVRRSQDGGQTWFTVPQLPAKAGFSDPTNPRNIYITAGSAGPYFSPDLGDSWTSWRADMDNPYVTQIAVAANGTLYAVSTPQPSAFVAKLNAGLSKILACTAYGGSGGVTPTGIAVDSQGRPVIAGYTDSRDLPVTTGGPASPNTAGFIARFSSDLSILDFARFLSGSSYAAASGLTILTNGQIAVAGTAYAGFPTTPNAEQPAAATSTQYSGFVSVLDQNGVIVYSSLLGGLANDSLGAIRASGAQLYIGGFVRSPDFPGLTQPLSAVNGVAAVIRYDLANVAPPPGTPSVNPSSGSSPAATFTFTFSDPSGFQNLGVVNVLINSALDGRLACYLAYSQPLGVLYLVNDQSTSLSDGIPLNSAGAVSNSQCTVFSSGSNAVGNGSILTLTLQIGFASTFAGSKVIYLAARDIAGRSTGWQPRGVWQVPSLPAALTTAVVGMSPTQGSGSGPQLFSFTFSDQNGYQDLGTANILIDDSLNGYHSCYLGYSRPANALYLFEDSGQAISYGRSLANPGRLGNNQCIVTWDANPITAAGNTITLNLSFAFASSYHGQRIFYLATRNIHESDNTGWQPAGTWTVK